MMSSYPHVAGFLEEVVPVPHSMPPKLTLSQVFTRLRKISHPRKGG